MTASLKEAGKKQEEQEAALSERVQHLEALSAESAEELAAKEQELESARSQVRKPCWR